MNFKSTLPGGLGRSLEREIKPYSDADFCRIISEFHVGSGLGILLTSRLFLSISVSSFSSPSAHVFLTENIIEFVFDQIGKKLILILNENGAEKTFLMNCTDLKSMCEMIKIANENSIGIKKSKFMSEIISKKNKISQPKIAAAIDKHFVNDEIELCEDLVSAVVVTKDLLCVYKMNGDQLVYRSFELEKISSVEIGYGKTLSYLQIIDASTNNRIDLSTPLLISDVLVATIAVLKFSSVSNIIWFPTLAIERAENVKSKVEENMIKKRKIQSGESIHIEKYSDSQEIERLGRLLESGLINETEFKALKTKIIS